MANTSWIRKTLLEWCRQEPGKGCIFSLCTIMSCINSSSFHYVYTMWRWDVSETLAVAKIHSSWTFSWQPSFSLSYAVVSAKLFLHLNSLQLKQISKISGLMLHPAHCVLFVLHRYIQFDDLKFISEHGKILSVLSPIFWANVCLYYKFSWDKFLIVTVFCQNQTLSLTSFMTLGINIS